MASNGTALLVFGLQTDMTEPSNACDDYLAHVSRFIEFVRQYPIQIVFLILNYARTYDDLDDKGILGSDQPGRLVVEPSDRDFVVDMFRLDAFINTSLEAFLRLQGIRNLIMFGSDTEGAILSTVIHARSLDYHCNVVHDLCGSQRLYVHNLLMDLVLPLYSTITDAHSLAEALVSKYGHGLLPMSCLPDASPPVPPHGNRQETEKPRRSTKPKSNEALGFRKWVILKGAEDVCQAVPGGTMMVRERPLWTGLPHSIIDANVEEDHPEIITVQDAEQPTTGTLDGIRKGMEEQINEPIHTREDPSPDMSDKELLTTTRRLSPSPNFEDEVLYENLPRYLPRSPESEDEAIYDDLQLEGGVYLDEEDIPYTDNEDDLSPNEDQEMMTPSTIQKHNFFSMPQTPLLASVELRSRDDTRSWCSLVEEPVVASSSRTRGESSSSPSEKRTFSQTISKWTPVNNENRPVSPSFGMMPLGISFGAPPAKRRKSPPIQDEKGKQNAVVNEVDDDLDVESDSESDDEEPRTPSPEYSLASTFEEKMKVGEFRFNKWWDPYEFTKHRMLDDAKQAPQDYLIKARRFLRLPKKPRARRYSTEIQDEKLSRYLSTHPKPTASCIDPGMMKRAAQIPPERLQSLEPDDIPSESEFRSKSRLAVMKVLEFAAQRFSRPKEEFEHDDYDRLCHLNRPRCQT